MRTLRPLVALVGAAFGATLTSTALPVFAQDGPAPGDTTSPPSGAEKPASGPGTGATPPPAGEVDAASLDPGFAGPPADMPPPPSEAPSRLPALASSQVTPKDAAPEEPDDGALRYHQDHFLGFVGARVGKISSSGLDLFSDSDELAQFSLGLGGTLMKAGNFSIAGLFLYDIGGHSGEARGADTDLTVHRLTLGGEARYHFIRQLFVFGRVAPGVIHSIAKVEDRTAGAQTLAARHWVFAADLSAGAMLELSGWSGDSRKRRPSVWLAFDGGYGFAGESELSLSADGGGPERAEPVELGELGLAGPFLRFAAVLTY
jgi:hypothetical protein